MVRDPITRRERAPARLDRPHLWAHAPLPGLMCRAEPVLYSMLHARAVLHGLACTCMDGVQTLCMGCEMEVQATQHGLQATRWVETLLSTSFEASVRGAPARHKQRGRAAEEAANVFYYLTYEGAVALDDIPDAQQRKARAAQTPPPPRVLCVHGALCARHARQTVHAASANGMYAMTSRQRLCDITVQ